MYFIQIFNLDTLRVIIYDTTTDVLSEELITIPGFIFFNGSITIPQKDSTTPIVGIFTELFNAVVRNGKLWTSFAVDDGTNKTVINWYEIDINTNTLVQSGTVDPGAGIFAFGPSINVDSNNNMGLTFYISGSNNYPSVVITGRLSGDPLGTTQPIQIVKVSNTISDLSTLLANITVNPNGRYGRGSQCAIDAGDELTFWATNHKMNSTLEWQQVITSFKMN